VTPVNNADTRGAGVAPGPDSADYPTSRPARIAIVGAGHVGATLAYSLVMNGLAPEIVLIDQDRYRAEGEAMDLNHAVPFSAPCRVWAGDYRDCAGAAVVVLTAGAGQEPGETRLDLAGRNAVVFKDVVPRVTEVNRGAILLVATNPVDVLTYATWKLSGLAAHRVIGSGTILDTARFRYRLSQYFGVDARSVHAYVIGEHGDSEVPVWSLANIAGMRLPDFRAAHDLGPDQAAMDGIVEDTRRAAYHIIERKGATYYAVAAGLLRILEAILRDQATVLSVSSLVPPAYGIGEVCLSVPTVVTRNGIERVLHLPLSDEETTAFRRSGDVVRNTIEHLDLPAVTPG
jgi:L-lactate dehydrogenase